MREASKGGSCEGDKGVLNGERFECFLLLPWVTGAGRISTLVRGLGKAQEAGLGEGTGRQCTWRGEEAVTRVREQDLRVSSPLAPVFPGESRPGFSESLGP